MSRPFFEKVAQLKDVDGNYSVKYVNIEGNMVSTLFGYVIEISAALDAGEEVEHVPVIFGSIEDSYTVGVQSNLKVKEIKDAVSALSGKAGYVAEFYGGGAVTNYHAIAKGTIA